MASKYTGILVVNGITLPDPSEMKQSDYDISDSERNAKGKMVAQMIRENVHKLECKWKILRPEEYAAIRSAISGSFGLSVSYYVADKGSMSQLEMYVGDRTTPVYTLSEGWPVYKDFSVNFIEM